MDVLHDLNKEQRRAAEAGDGPVLIVAGPGTGKTKTLIARIGFLLQQGVKPERILALTFTVKAAGEMRERVAALSGGQAPHISTFHALGYKVLREANPDAKPEFISEADRTALIRELPRPKELSSLSARELGLAISRYKGSIAPDESSALGQFVVRYQQQLHHRNLVDFDDLLFRTSQLLQQDSARRETWRSRYDHVLIDEFQDTSELQWELIRQLRSNDNIFVIGDPKQSIYGFRGATSDMFARFRKELPGRTDVTLHVNYRSARAIVELASAIFGGADALTPHSSEQGNVQALVTLNEFSEADFVLAQIEEGIGGSDLLKASSGVAHRKFQDFAVLYRTHQAARVIQQRLHDSGIPFQVVGEGSPFEQPEVQALIGLLRRIHGDEAALPRGFSQAQVAALLEKVDSSLPVSKLAETCIQTFNLAGDDKKRQRLAQFVSTLVRFDTAADGLRQCLAYIDRISQEAFYDPDADAVTLLTIHASKGLEFTHVMIIAAEEGILPHIRKTAETDIDEERRLFYVAATRAKERLDVLYTKKRAGESRQPSRYILELSEQALHRQMDPAMERLEGRLRRREQKNRQGTLF